jgi:hypothetical protein
VLWSLRDYDGGQRPLRGLRKILLLYLLVNIFLRKMSKFQNKIFKNRFFMAIPSFTVVKDKLTCRTLYFFYIEVVYICTQIGIESG